jgi:hypothetical protein
MSEFGAELPIGLHPMDGPSCSNPAVCFALPAGIGDVTNGCFAIVVAALLALKEVDARRATYSWCFFGNADLVVAIMMGAMTSPGRRMSLPSPSSTCVLGLCKSWTQEWEPIDRLNPA